MEIKKYGRLCVLFRIFCQAWIFFQVLCNAGKFSKTFQDAGKFYKIFQDARKFYKIFQDAGKFYKILQDAGKFYKLFQDAGKFYNIFYAGFLIFLFYQKLVCTLSMCSQNFTAFSTREGSNKSLLSKTSFLKNSMIVADVKKTFSMHLSAEVGLLGLGVLSLSASFAKISEDLSGSKHRMIDVQVNVSPVHSLSPNTFHFQKS